MPQGRRLLALDMASLGRAIKYRAIFEERFKNLLEEFVRDGSAILFVDEFHHRGSGAVGGYRRSQHLKAGWPGRAAAHRRDDEPARWRDRVKLVVGLAPPRALPRRPPAQ